VTHAAAPDFRTGTFSRQTFLRGAASAFATSGVFGTVRAGRTPVVRGRPARDSLASAIGRKQSAVAQWYVETSGQASTAAQWVNTAHQAVQPYSVGGYVNDLEASTSAARYFGSNLSRLTAVRQSTTRTGSRGWTSNQITLQMLRVGSAPKFVAIFAWGRRADARLVPREKQQEIHEEGMPGSPPVQAGQRSAGHTAVALCYGLICHSCFALGVGAMVIAMFFGMSRSLGTVPAPYSWIANAALIAQFPLVHSALLTNRGRRLLARLAPQGTGTTLATTTFATIAALQVLALFALWSPSGTVWWQAHGAARVVLVALYATSWLLLGKSMMDAGLALQTGSLGWIAMLRGRQPVYPVMPQTGLFRLTRHPVYVSFALTLWTVPTWTPDQLVIALVFTAYCVRAPLLKEARFRRMYGSAFDDYARGVPYWLPRLRLRAPGRR
jgi:methanethiol S-methyltransferase